MEKFTIDSKVLDEIYEWTIEDNNRWPAMSFEDGVRAMIDVIHGNSTPEELMEDL